LTCPSKLLQVFYIASNLRKACPAIGGDEKSRKVFFSILIGWSIEKQPMRTEEHDRSHLNKDLNAEVV